MQADRARPDLVTLLFQCGAHDAAGVQALRDDVAARYGEPHRHYHCLTHAAAVADSVTTLAEASGLTDSRAALLAAWLHDVVYDTHASDNEDSSADYATTALSNLGVDSGLVQRCGQLIRVTATHMPTALDEAVLCDADLAILAAEPEHYRAYTRQIRQEYGWVTQDEFSAGRAAILQGLLARDALYRTLYAARWEAPARANVDTEIRELSGNE